MTRFRKKDRAAGSWEGVSSWYDRVVGEKGHYYHQAVILPAVKRILKSQKAPYRLLDLACGQGVLAREIPKDVDYTGVDISSSFVQSAKKQSPKRTFLVGDVSKKLDLPTDHYDWITCILAVQDIADAGVMIKHAASYLKPGGRLLIVMNHPCFRIPRVTHWGVDEAQKLQYRRVNSYLSPMAVPIQTRPSKGKRADEVTSYHRPLSTYFGWLNKAGLLVENIEEWVSDKKSTGGKARMENRARKEFPLFLCLIAKKP